MLQRIVELREAGVLDEAEFELIHMQLLSGKPIAAEILELEAALEID